MSRGHSTATHTRAVYADLRNCAICARAAAERAAVVAEQLQAEQMRLEDERWEVDPFGETAKGVLKLAGVLAGVLFLLYGCVAGLLDVIRYGA